MRDPKPLKTGDLKKKVLLGILSSPLTVLPFLGGMTALMATWALNIRPDLGLLGLLAGVLVAGGAFLTQLVVGGEKRAGRALEELRKEAHDAREQGLNDLAGRLEGDNDDRTEKALADLRALSEALDALDEQGLIDSRSPLVIEIKLGAAKLFNQCVVSLEQSLKLWHTAQGMVTKSARQPIVKQREKLVKDVYESIRHLGELLVSLQQIGKEEESESKLGNIRNELNRNLKVAERVDARMKAFESEIEHELSRNTLN